MANKKNPFEKNIEYNPDDFKKSEKVIEAKENKVEKDPNEWQEQSNAYAKAHGIPKRVIDIDRNQDIYNSTWHNFLIIFMILTIISVGIIFSWGTINDKFGTKFYDNSTMVCNITIPEYPTCPQCPSASCGDVNVPECPVCPSFPEEINIVLSDELEGNESG